eukprot:7029040-Prymnesium_polylepis.1
MGGDAPQWALPISSVNEDRMLTALGLSRTDRVQIEGLSSIKVRGGLGLTEEQLSSRAVVRLALERLTCDVPLVARQGKRGKCSTAPDGGI